MFLGSGERLGPYEIIAPIGAGGMGEVYRARDPGIECDVAIKVLSGELSRDPARLSRFEREARAAGRLNHPNILVVYDVGNQDGVPYLVTELVEGRTLREEMGRGPISRERAVRWAREIARGLAAAHDAGIVYRDVKPENIIVTTDGRVKILDFGIAKLMMVAHEDEDSEAPTRSVTSERGVVVGTVSYLSPEQSMAEAVDSRTDIFSLGIVLYEMLAGRHPFRRGTSVQTMSAIQKDDAPRLDALPPGLSGIVARCLEKQPEQRFRSASDLAFALETVNDAAPVASPSKRTFIPMVVLAAFLAAVTGLWS